LKSLGKFEHGNCSLPMSWVYAFLPPVASPGIRPFSSGRQSTFATTAGDEVEFRTGAMIIHCLRPRGFPKSLLRSLVLGGCCGLLSGCGSFHSLSGPMRDAPCIYSGVRLDWAALRGDDHYVRQFRLVAPDYPALDLPASFAMDTVFLPLAVPRSIYQAIFVAKGL
jgi:uncharacterized protein YceK